ncbi:probable E3 ubiquitin-protein ligase RHA1A [Hibiscus syriacus]|uniref:probable E3 ubiquitin-protein ligase RHA1A n=1 Tax=Hibiscus syriacus TaxID=106335 RepID=UPI00192146F2|nr:probable E3 ubiquitin-protein ligase RHA1A [Hibiscus syriacus]
MCSFLRWALNLCFKHSSSHHFSLDSSSPSEIIRHNLVLTNFGDAKQRMPWVSDTCAVCLLELDEGDDLRELRNCSHVFHKDCIDRWVEYDEGDDYNRKRCPLCRSPLLLTSSQSLVGPNSEPSWAVDRLLYLFGDDLLP